MNATKPAKDLNVVNLNIGACFKQRDDIVSTSSTESGGVSPSPVCEF